MIQKSSYQEMEMRSTLALGFAALLGVSLLPGCSKPPVTEGYLPGKNPPGMTGKADKPQPIRPGHAPVQDAKPPQKP
jgi:hypothetical protein